MHDERSDFGKATGLLLSLTEAGPVSGWVDRIGELVRRSGTVPACSVSWQGSPVDVAHNVAEALGFGKGVGPLLAFLRGVQAEREREAARPKAEGPLAPAAVTTEMLGK